MSTNFSLAALEMDDAEGPAGPGHLSDRQAQPTATDAGHAVPGADPEGDGVRGSLQGHDRE